MFLEFKNTSGVKNLFRVNNAREVKARSGVFAKPASVKFSGGHSGHYGNDAYTLSVDYGKFIEYAQKECSRPGNAMGIVRLYGPEYDDLTT